MFCELNELIYSVAATVRCPVDVGSLLVLVEPPGELGVDPEKGPLRQIPLGREVRTPSLPLLHLNSSLARKLGLPELNSERKQKSWFS